MKPKEHTVCGLAAVKALFARDAGAIKRLYFDYPTGRRIGIICKALALARKVYRCVEPDELEKISGTVHHGGIVAVIEPRVMHPPRPEDLRRWAHARAPLLLLDRIGNVHNLGAIVRSAAFFGVEHIVIPEDPEQARPGEAAYRVAEGGMEHVEIHAVKSLAAFIHEAKPFYRVIGTAVRGAAPIVGGGPVNPPGKRRDVRSRWCSATRSAGSRPRWRRPATTWCGFPEGARSNRSTSPRRRRSSAGNSSASEAQPQIIQGFAAIRDARLANI